MRRTRRCVVASAGHEVQRTRPAPMPRRAGADADGSLPPLFTPDAQRSTQRMCGDSTTNAAHAVIGPRKSLVCSWPGRSSTLCGKWFRFRLAAASIAAAVHRRHRKAGHRSRGEPTVPRSVRRVTDKAKRRGHRGSHRQRRPERHGRPFARSSRVRIGGDSIAEKTLFGRCGVPVRHPVISTPGVIHPKSRSRKSLRANRGIAKIGLLAGMSRLPDSFASSNNARWSPHYPAHCRSDESSAVGVDHGARATDRRWMPAAAHTAGEASGHTG